jgi:tRNA(Arg) A34 adenosine deaminase TadA
MDDSLALRKAIRLAAAHSASGHNGPFGAVVTRGDDVVGEGWNQVVELHDPTAHAEVMAIRAACARLATHDLSGCVLYTSCEPCPLCLAAAYWAHIPKVVYAASREDAAAAGFDDADVYGELSRRWADRKVESVQLLHEQGRRVLQAWSDNVNKISY